MPGTQIFCRVSSLGANFFGFTNLTTESPTRSIVDSSEIEASLKTSSGERLDSAAGGRLDTTFPVCDCSEVDRCVVLSVSAATRSS